MKLIYYPCLTTMLFLVLWAQLGFCHSRAESYSRIYIDGALVDLNYTMQLNQLFYQLLQKSGQTGGDYSSIETYFTDEVLANFVLTSRGIDCEKSKAVSFQRTNNLIRISWQVKCVDSASIQLNDRAFFSLLPEHIHISRVATMEGDIVEKILVEGKSHWELVGAETGAEPITGSSFGTYLQIGIEHIVSGYDHLAFLLAVLLVCRQIKIIIWSITGFTLGHSLTLCAAVLGFAAPPIATIEALIGWTIALVAAEIVCARYGVMRGLIVACCLFSITLFFFGACSLTVGDGLDVSILIGLTIFSVCYLALSDRTEIKAVIIKPGLTMIFGLIHGFGFAGSLQEIGLPVSRLALALLGFNLGVEIGQVILVLLVVLTAILAVRWIPLLKHWIIIDGSAAILCGLGTYWLIVRAYT